MKLSRTTIGVIVVFVAILAAIGYYFWREHNKDNSQQAWQAILRKCADTNLLGSNVVYFGASNKVGPGSIWRRSKDGSYRLFLELSDLEKDPQKRAALIVVNNEVSCQGGANSQWSVDIGLPFESATTPLKADVSADLKRARTVTVTVAGYALDELKEGLFEDLIRKDSRFNQNLGSFVIASNAIRVTGFTADFTFPESAVAEIRPKYKDNFISLKDGATLKTNWTSDTTLRMNSTEPFYMLAAFSNIVLSKNGNDIRVAQKETVPVDEVGAVGNERPTTAPSKDKDVEAAIKANLSENPAQATAIYLPDTGTIHLKGTVATANDRDTAEKVAKSVPDVQEVVNELQVRNQKVAPDAKPF